MNKPHFYGYYTNGKTAELTIFLNIALLRTLRLCFYWSNAKNIVPNFEQLDKEFKKYLVAFVEHKFSSIPTEEDLPEIVYSKLREYFWKGHQENKNKSGHMLTDADKKIIRMMIYKLYALRNFHSHIWHPNHQMKFNFWPASADNAFGEGYEDDTLLNFIQSKHDDLLQRLSIDNRKVVNKFEQKKDAESLFHKEGYIRPYGKTFFLSFFLTRGEMTRLLQQQQRNIHDSELKHWLNRRVLTSFTHRDGATRHVFNQEESMLSALPMEEQETILKVRSAYQIINYLNDVPASANDTQLYPLLIQLGDALVPATNAEDMQLFCEATEVFDYLKISVMQVKPRDLPPGAVTTNTVNSNSRLHLLLKEHLNETGFTVSASTLHKLVLDSWRSPDLAKRIKEQFNYFFTERLQLIKLLKGMNAVAGKRQINQVEIAAKELIEAVLPPLEATLEEEFSYFNRLKKELEDYGKFKLRGSEALLRKFENWYYDFLYQWQPRKLTKNNRVVTINPEPASRHALLEALSNPQEAIIELSYHSFFFGQEQKPRSEDMFSIYAVKFLCDYKLTPGWKWQFVSFEDVEKVDKKTGAKKSVNKPISDYSETWLGKKKLAYSNGNVRFCYKGYYFELGHKALKNLLITYFDPSQKQLTIQEAQDKFTAYADMLLKKALTIEAQLKNGTPVNQPATFENYELPRHLKLAMQLPDAWQQETQTQTQIASRIRYILEKLKSERETSQALSKNAKNEQIMRCYRYFNWAYPGQTEFKFLRKDEYNRMSMYHYLLGKKHSLTELSRLGYRIDPATGEHRNINHQAIKNSIGQINKLLTDGGENSISHRLPAEISEMLNTAKNLDELFDLVLTKTDKLLRRWKRSLDKATPEEIDRLLQKLDLPMRVTPDNLEEAKPIWAEAFQRKALSVHPLSVITFFYPQEYAKAVLEAEEKQRAEGTPCIPRFSLSEKIWKNTALNAQLRTEHYQCDTYTKFLDSLELELIQQYSTNRKRNIVRKVRGKNTEQRTEDGILLLIALRYMNDSQSDIMIGVKNALKKEGGFKVGSLRKQSLAIPIKAGNEKGILDMYFHQLDDYLIIESKVQLERAFTHYLLRLKGTKNEPQKLEGVYRVPYIKLVDEINKVYQHALFVSKSILSWEEKIISALAELPEKEWVNFEAVSGHAGLTGEQAEMLRKDLRNNAFHGGIPKGFTYKMKMLQNGIVDLLNVNPKDLNESLK